MPGLFQNQNIIITQYDYGCVIVTGVFRLYNGKVTVTAIVGTLYGARVPGTEESWSVTVT